VKLGDAILDLPALANHARSRLFQRPRRLQQKDVEEHITPAADHLCGGSISPKTRGELVSTKHHQIIILDGLCHLRNAPSSQHRPVT
jgi:hypothetical protein